MVKDRKASGKISLIEILNIKVILRINDIIKGPSF